MIFTPDKTIARLLKNQPAPSCRSALRRIKDMMDVIVRCHNESPGKRELRELAELAKAYNVIRYFKHRFKLK